MPSSNAGGAGSGEGSRGFGSGSGASRPNLTRLGPYEILGPLGAGGMGEVFRARDTRLGREVAIKILRGDVADNADRRARFEREARTVAALSHPNIVALYEVGNDDSVEYTVSELVSGETLRSVMMRDGALPVRRVVELATQIADGMAAAHAAGIVHRDLKPENVMLTRDGRVKILDFGLARVASTAQFGGSGTGSGSAMEDTLLTTAVSDNLTGAGVVLGTAAYMSPEQAKGLEADYRSDQFSFGLIVYEMLNGKQAFARDSAVETMAAIVRDEPTPLDAKVPTALRWIVERCLEKDPAQRYDSTKDLYQQLRMLRDHFSEVASGSGVSSGVGLLPSVAAARRGMPWAAAIAGILLALTLGGGIAWWMKPARRHLDRYKFTPFAVESYGQAVWSPEGKSVAYMGKIGMTYEMFVRDLDSPTAQQVTHLAGMNLPLGWSSDGAHLIFIHRGLDDPTNTKFSVISRLGGAATTLITARDQWASQVALSPDGKTLARFAGMKAGGDFHLTISNPVGSPWRDYGNLPEPVTAVFNGPSLSFSQDGKRMLLAYDGQNGDDYIWSLPYPANSGKPQREFRNVPHANGTPMLNWLPDGKRVVVSTTTEAGRPYHLWLLKLGSDAMDQLTVGTSYEWSPAVSPNGKDMVYLETQMDFDIVSVSLTTGEVTPLISTAMMELMPQYAARSGRLTYVTDRQGPMEIWLREPDGSTRPLVTQKDVPGGVKWFMSPALSPDGSRVIFSVTPPTGVPRLWMSSVSGGAPVRVTNATDDGGEYPGDWSPDGSQFVFRTYRNGQPGLAVVSTDGVAQLKQLGTMGGEAMPALPSWSPVGDRIAYRDTGGYFFMDPDGGHKRLFLKLAGNEYVPNLAFSKDGKTLYGTLTALGKVELISVDADTGAKKTIRELPPTEAAISNLTPTLRFSLAPDGQSITYATGQFHSTLWLFQGWGE